MDSSGLLKVQSKPNDPHCEANTELKLRAAWQRRSFSMDLAGLATFEVMESWVRYLFQQLIKDQPKGFTKIGLQQLSDKQLFVQASHITMGKLQSTPPDPKPLDAVVNSLKTSTDVLQYLVPLPSAKVRDPPPAPAMPRPAKTAKTTAAAAKSGGKQQPASGSKISLPDGCVSHDDQNRPLCFRFQTGKCKFKGPAGKRCASGFHNCYKRGCFRPKPYYLCTHTD